MPIADVRAHFQNHGPSICHSDHSFAERKAKLMEECNVKSDSQNEDTLSLLMCVPYGMFYKNDFIAFTNGTTFYSYITAPATVGGDLTDWLYLTATNGSVKGVEACMTYHGQERGAFSIYDWSLPKSKNSDRWVCDVTYDELVPYMQNVRINGMTLASIYVANSTRVLRGTTWTNEVLLYDHAKQRYDLVYVHEYSLGSNEEQRWYCWGPIVESDHHFKSRTNPLGFSSSSLIQDDRKDESSQKTTPTSELTGSDLNKSISNQTIHSLSISPYNLAPCS
jgi:hypothetical protein